MRAILNDFLCCPECRHFPLELCSLEEGRIDPLPARSAQSSPDETRDIISGILSCAGCQRLYFIVEGIPRLISEEYGELVDTSLLERLPPSFEGRREQLDAFRARLEQRAETSDVSRWNVEDVEFWEDEYARPETTRHLLEWTARSRPDAGNRTYPRERNIFRHLRLILPGGALLDLGCGLAQTVRTLCHPAEVGYLYIGAELSISALRVNRASLPGEYVQCSADRLPFRAASVDAITMLGTLHHLADHDGTLRRVLDTLRAGGWIGLHEVATHESLSSHLPFGDRLRGSQSSHNESVDVDLVRSRLSEAGSIRVLHRGYSPLRALLVRWLDEPMRTRPRLTKAVLGFDVLCIRSLGRLSPAFEGREMIVLAQKRPEPA